MNPRGSSLAEVIVAVVLLGVGVLALTGTSGAIARMTGMGRHASTSAALASSRLERLRAAPCPTDVVSGASSEGAFREEWEASPGGGGRLLRVIIRYEDGRLVRADTYETRSVCSGE